MSTLRHGLVLWMLVIAGCGTSSSTPVDPCAANPAACGCADDSQCADPTPRCDTRVKGCVPCLPTADNCAPSMHCVNDGKKYSCVPKDSCLAAADCPPSGGRPGICCGGKCADPINDANNCGACGTTCASYPNSTGGCVGGACGIVQCNSGFGDCDKKAANGCEGELLGDVTHCGSCETPCKKAPNSMVSCVAGRCASQCNADFADCDNEPANGCETSTTTNPRNCGGCGMVCGNLPNAATVACSSGACVVETCSAAYRDCNRQAGDGCEADTSADPAHCGGCGRKCPPVDHGGAGCSMGSCGVGKCDQGFGDCDGNVLNGCELDLSSDPKNCGACGNTCAAPNGMAVCQGGVCLLQACNQGWADCDMMAANGCEVAVSRDLKHCGACNNVCPVPANATAQCSVGVCGVGSCMYGWGDCNNNINDGCETSLLQVSSCGACNVMCAVPPNAIPACPGAVCAVGKCNAGFADCDNKVVNGCEINLTDDGNNCGGCGSVCMSQKNQVGSCVASKCVLGACVKNFGDCNNNLADGCEKDLAADVKNCGACNNVCPMNTPNCFNGVCQAGFTHHTGLGQTWIDNIPTGTLDINQAAVACQTYVNQALGGQDQCSLNGCGCGGQNLCVYNINKAPRYTWFYNYDTMGGQVTLNCCGCQPAGMWD